MRRLRQDHRLEALQQLLEDELPKRDPREELLSRLEKAKAEHAEAILAGLEVLQSLHERGVLELLRGVLGGGNKILEIAVEATKSPEAIRGIRNLLIMSNVVGSIEPEVLKKFAAAVPDAIAVQRRRKKKSRRFLGSFADIGQPKLASWPCRIQERA